MTTAKPLPVIEDRLEGARGCGYRKGGGLYLVADGPSAPCDKLPIPLEVCPVCSSGIKPTRGWTWVNGTQLAGEKVCSAAGTLLCKQCPLAYPMGRVGLVWIGEAFYKTPAAFLDEAQRQGVSRRISAVPRGFEVGETWVWMAHRKGIPNADGSFTPAVFRVFKPQRIEYVVTGRETAQELDALAGRGLTLVRVHREGEPAQVEEEEAVEVSLFDDEGGA